MTDDFSRAAAALDPSRFSATAGKPVAAALDKAGETVQRHVRAAARPHRRTGKLEQYVSAKGSGQGLQREVRVHAGGRVAHLITGGTAPHEIAPVRTMAIAMTAPGAAGEPIGFAASVHHPGTKADPFVARGVEASERDLKHIVDAAGDALAHDLAKHMSGRR